MTIRCLVAIALLGLQTQNPGLVVPPLGPPTKTAPAATAQEVTLLREGIALYEQRQYDPAFAKFEAVHKANPDAIMAIYEMGLVHFARKEFQQAIDMGAKATTFIAPPGQLGQFYSLIGNTLDAAREPRKALEVYRKGLEVAPVVGLYYNMAVTQAQSLADLPGATASLKLGARVDPQHAGTQLLLGKIFGGEGLQTPALLALSRFLILEPATARTNEAYQLWYRLLDGSLAPTPGSAGTTITINPNQSRAEGNLMQLDLHISLSRVAAAKTAEARPQIQLMADQLSMLFQVFGNIDPAGDKDAFLFTYYMPYFMEMQKQGHTEAFVYFVSQRTNLPGVREWLTVNGEKINAFLGWSRKYAFPPALPAK